jgi:hypothetical protein
MDTVQIAPPADTRPTTPIFGLRQYRAEWAATQAHIIEPLDGTVAAAQQYVDRITRSSWWRKNCPPSWMGDEIRDGSPCLDCSKPPRRIIIKEARGTGARALGVVKKHRGKWFPVIHLGNTAGSAHPLHHPPLRDQWTILHEIAHIGTPNDPGHGREFARFYLALVSERLGVYAARALRTAYAAEGVKYRLKRSISA